MCVYLSYLLPFFSYELCTLKCDDRDEAYFLLRPTQIMLLYSPGQNHLFPVLCRELCPGFLMLVLFYSVSEMLTK